MAAPDVLGILQAAAAAARDPSPPVTVGDDGWLFPVIASCFLSLGLVVVVVVAAVVEVAVVAVVAVVAMDVVLEEVLEEGEVMVLELGMGSVLVSRAMVVAVRGALVSRTEEREVGRVARAGFTWDSEVAGGMMAAVEVTASRRARNRARRAALRR